ncbi:MULTISPECIES: NB-ARC domain-containing protein [unclassified Crossiella]|uniref:NB-ARC domain-containing protein n=1 Tax=unclassified Crossiella TaxID=2620835 RepID=UPI001FFF9F7C|nr:MULTISPECIES: NB-ARC domain-containing protein [unclassified Crossiella]MCK2243712.1 NB-ARC domain-containing protein [Crossiella sp. S99.2]MCK2257571.1 NB-ARC domain-containing protein [Crossiella sp. S99.1]
MHSTTSQLELDFSPLWTNRDLAAVLEATRSANNALRPMPRRHSASAAAERAATCATALNSLRQLRPLLTAAVTVAAGNNNHQLAVELAEALGEQVLPHFDCGPVEAYLLQRAIEAARRDRNWLGESRLRLRLTMLLLDSGPDAAALQLINAETARAFYTIEQAGDTADARTAEAVALSVSSLTSLRAGDLEAAQHTVVDAITLARVLKDERRQGEHTVLLAEILAQRGEYRIAQKHLFDALELLAAAGDDLGQGRVFTALCRLALLQGRADLGLPDAATAVRRLENLGYRRYLAVAKSMKSIAHHELGQRAEAEFERAGALDLVTPGTPSARLVQEVLELPARLPSAAMLAGLRRLDASTRPTPASPTPPALARVPPPGAFSVLVGREDELARLTAAGETVTVTGPMVVGISGPAGTGKSALAHRWAYLRGRDTTRFADGCLYAVLNHGALAPEVTTSIALDNFLRALAVPVTEIDAAGTLSAKHALFCWATAGKRLLLVLDDVVDTADLGYLLPASPHSMVLITSREPVPTLCAGQIAISLDALDTASATGLLANTLGPQRVDGERPDAQRIAAGCAGNPAALQILAAGLALQPSTPLATAATALKSALTGDPSAIEAAVTVACSWLPQETVRAYHRLSVLPLTTLTWSIAAAALGSSSAEDAGRLLEELADRGLLTHGVEGHYRIPEALSVVMHQRAYTTLGLAECEAVIRRGITQAAYEAAVAGQHAVGDRENLRQWLPRSQWPTVAIEPNRRFDRLPAYDWLEAERIVITQVAVAATDRGDLSLVWMAAGALGRLCLHHGGVPEAMTVLTMAITCIREALGKLPRSKAARYRLLQADLLVTLSILTLCGLRAVPACDRSTLTGEAERHLHEAHRLSLPGNKLWKLGKLLDSAMRTASTHHADQDVAEALHRLVMEQARQAGKQRPQGQHTWVLGTLLAATGRDEEAVAAFTAAEELLHSAVDKALVLLSAAALFAGQRRLDRAITLLEHAATLLHHLDHAILLATVHAAHALASGMCNIRRQAIASRNAALALLPAETDNEQIRTALKPLEGW